MRKLIVFFVIIICSACKKDPEVDPTSFITSHVWRSVNYVVEGRQYDKLEQSLAMHNSLFYSDITFVPGDTLKYKITFELLFTDAKIFKETKKYETYYRCQNCNNYVLIGTDYYEDQDVFFINSSYLFVTPDDVILRDENSNDSHRYKFISNRKLELFSWKFFTNNAPDIYDISINGTMVQPGENIPVDIIFEPIY